MVSSQSNEPFKHAVQHRDAAALRRLLESSPDARVLVNAPMFAFGGRAINAAADHLDVIDVLLEFGADINLRSDWDKGPFSILESCGDESIARQLIARGAKLTAHAAAKFGWIDELQHLLAADPSVVH